MVLLPTELEVTITIIYRKTYRRIHRAVRLFLYAHRPRHISVGDQSIASLSVAVLEQATVLLHVVRASADVAVHKEFGIVPQALSAWVLATLQSINQ